MNRELSIQANGFWKDILINFGISPDFLKNKHGPCPICSGKDRFRFDNKNGSGSFYCSGHGAGDGVVLAMQYTGLSFKECASEVRRIIGKCKMQTTVQTDIASNEARIKKIHAGLKIITPDSIAAKYFASRGIRVLPEKDCYFHPSISYYDNGNRIGTYPAIVSVFRTASAETATYHLTYLSSDGKKLDCQAPKKILPVIRPLTGSAIRLFRADDAVCIAEGVESALAVHMDTGMPVWASGNANNMANMEIPEEIKHVYIYADEDNNFTGQEAAYRLARRLSITGNRETVKVVRLLERNQFVDSGDQFDFLDYVISAN